MAVWISVMMKEWWCLKGLHRHQLKYIQIMKQKIVLLLLLNLSWLSQAQTEISNYTNSTVAVIPDGNPVGVAEQFTVSGVSGTVSNVTVQIDITGGFNGDLYAYLVDPQGNLAVLVNRPGVMGGNPFGYGDAGINITLSSEATNDLHSYKSGSYTITGGQLTGTWAADGRNINPQSSPTVFGSASPTAGLSLYGGFNGSDLNGTWTLFVADVVAGGGSPTLQGAILSIMTVPEPSPIFLVALGVLMLWTLLRKRTAKGTR
jgi:hypothetical protein